MIGLKTILISVQSIGPNLTKTRKLNRTEWVIGLFSNRFGNRTNGIRLPYVSLIQLIRSLIPGVSHLPGRELVKMERGWIDYKRQNISAILLQRFSWNLAMVCLKLIHACSRSLTKIYQQNFLLDTIFQEGWSMKMLITLKIFFISLIKYNYTTTE